MDWRQLWEICSAPDNVPIVGLIPLLIFYIYLAWKQAKANDELIGELETNPAMAKTHHRKTWPFRPGWQKEIHVWPFLLRIEFLAAIIVTIILMVWSITLSAPLEEPSNPNLTMNPGKSAVVLPRPAGNAGVLRSVDRGRGDADADHHRADGHSLHRHQSAGQRLLHLEAAQVCHRHISVRLHHSLGRDDHYRDFHSRARLAVVLAGTNLGSQSPDLRGEPRFAGYFRAHLELGKAIFGAIVVGGYYLAADSWCMRCSAATTRKIISA